MLISAFMLMGTSVSISEFFRGGGEKKKAMILIGLKARLFIFKILICFLHSVFISRLVIHYPRTHRPLKTHRIALVTQESDMKGFCLKGILYSFQAHFLLSSKSAWGRAFWDRGWERTKMPQVPGLTPIYFPFHIREQTLVTLEGH